MELLLLRAKRTVDPRCSRFDLFLDGPVFRTFPFGIFGGHTLVGRPIQRSLQRYLRVSIMDDICGDVRTFLSPFLQAHRHSLLQRIDVRVVLDDLSQ